MSMSDYPFVKQLHADRTARLQREQRLLRRALNNWLSHLLFNGGPEDPLPILQEAEQEVARRGLGVVRAKLHSSWLRWAEIDGDLERAELEVQRGQLLGSDALEYHAYATIEGHLALERGDVERAEECLRLSLDLAARNDKQVPWARLLGVAVAAEQGVSWMTGGANVRRRPRWRRCGAASRPTRSAPSSRHRSTGGSSTPRCTPVGWRTPRPRCSRSRASTSRPLPGPGGAGAARSVAGPTP